MVYVKPKKENRLNSARFLSNRWGPPQFLFSSLRPEDITFDPEKTARGVRVLRNYLIYARDGRLDPGVATGRGPDSPFEIAVAEALRARGHMVELQVGVAGYFIDIAIRHPAKRASFVVGIECDGAGYHSAKSARDRDRLRQEALERLGWRLVRVWSTDWFRDHVAEADRLSSRVNAIIDADQETGVTAIRMVERPSYTPNDDTRHDADSAVPTFDPEPTEIDVPSRTKRSLQANSTAPSFTHQDLAAKLRNFRDEVVLVEYPGSEPERCILRDEMITAIVQENLNDPDDFTVKIPQWIRTRTDGPQVKYLDQICDLVDQYGADIH
jgi:very-short-patch-repair endonuclease